MPLYNLDSSFLSALVFPDVICEGKIIGSWSGNGIGDKAGGMGEN
jgi:hypothetical protein